MKPTTKPTTINAPNAIIHTESNTKPSKSAKRRRRRAQKKKQEPEPRIPESSGFSANSVVKAMPVRSLMSKPCTFHDSAQAWMELYIDPLNVSKVVPGSRKVPDAAMPISAEAGFYFAATMELPMTNLSQTNVTGLNFSMLVLMPPLLRAMGIVLVHTKSRDFDAEVMSAFCVAFASVEARSDAYFPKWVPCPLYDEIEGFLRPVLFFTVLAPNALRAVEEPDENGISTLLNQFRFTSFGLDINHNTPTWFDNGTFMAGCFNCSVESSTYVENGVRGFEPFWLQATILTGTNFQVRTSVGGFPMAPMTELDFAGLTPSPDVTLSFDMRNADSSFIATVGNVVNYRFVAGNLVLFNSTRGTSLIIGAFTQGMNHVKRLYSRVPLPEALDELISETEIEFNKLILPPTTQSDIFQMDPKRVSGKMKGDHEEGKPGTHSGVYLPNRIWQPVFNVQSAGNFRKCVIVSQDSSLGDLTNPDLGWFDSFDRNYGWGVINLQNVPYAAAPFITAARTDEQVPGVNSIIGAYTTGAQAKEPLCFDAAMAVGSRLPHGASSMAGRFSELFPAIRRGIASIPRLVASATNILDQVNDVMDDLNI